MIRTGGPTPLNITFIGDVPQGALINPILGGNSYSILSSPVPQALPLGSAGQAATLQFPALNGDTVFLFNPATQAYKDSYTYFDGFGWFSANPDDPGPNGPIIPVGTSFFVYKRGPSQSWVRNFHP